MKKVSYFFGCTFKVFVVKLIDSKYKGKKNMTILSIQNIDDFFNALEYNYKIVIPTEEDCEIFNEWLRMNDYEIYMLPKEGTWYNINYENVVLEEELIKQIKDFKQKNSLVF